MGNKLKICIFGGTFNPVHNGHINMIKAVLHNILPNKLFVIPAGNSYFKTNVLSSSYRYNMVKLALDDDFDNCRNIIELSDIEILREGPSYSIDTIDYYKSLYDNSDIYFVIGEDTVYNIEKWYKASELLEKVKLVILRRSVNEQNNLSAKLDQLVNDYNTEYTVIDFDYNISSSEIRNMIISNDDSVNKFISKKVLEYIKDNNLYS